MIEEKTHSAIVLKSRQYIIFINSYIVLGVVLTGLLTWYFHIIAILWTGSMLFLLLPIVAILGQQYFIVNIFLIEYIFVTFTSKYIC